MIHSQFNGKYFIFKEYFLNSFSNQMLIINGIYRTLLSKFFFSPIFDPKFNGPHLQMPCDLFIIFFSFFLQIPENLLPRWSDQWPTHESFYMPNILLGLVLNFICFKDRYKCNVFDVSHRDRPNQRKEILFMRYHLFWLLLSLGMGAVATPWPYIYVRHTKC